MRERSGGWRVSGVLEAIPAGAERMTDSALPFGPARKRYGATAWKTPVVAPCGSVRKAVRAGWQLLMTVVALGAALACFGVLALGRRRPCAPRPVDNSVP